MPNPPPAHLDNWPSRAACRFNPEKQFPVSERHGPGLRKAKSVCLGCPVRETCLNDALALNDRNGVWGGLSTPERRAYRDGAAIRVCAGCNLWYANHYNSGRCHPCTPAARRRLAARSPELAAVAR
jgi:WhiB family transcriptional regulator, redox-sensing transcriptional regulator